MTAPPDAAIQAGARVLAGDGPATADHHWQALAVWHAMQAHQWRPIATAPRGPHYGPAYMGVVDGQVRLIQWGKTNHVPIYGWCLADQGREDFDLCQPTHWQPLPPPPKPGDAP